jgi:hypothetical protein
MATPQPNLTAENNELILALLRLVQFLLAGEPTLHMSSCDTETISMYIPVLVLNYINTQERHREYFITDLS